MQYNFNHTLLFAMGVDIDYFADDHYILVEHGTNLLDNINIIGLARGSRRLHVGNHLESSF